VGGFSRLYGKNALNLGFTQDDSKATVERNRAAFLSKLGAQDQSGRSSRLWPLVTLRQVHSDIIRFVDSPSESQFVGDGLITGTPGLLLAIQTADCLPVILVDPKHRAVGVFHAGWRGTVTADCRKRSRRDAPLLRHPSARSESRHRSRHSRLLLRSGPGKSETSLTLSSPMRPSCSVWSKRSIPCVKNIPCYFSPHAPRAIAICQRKYSSTWWKRIVNNC